MSSGSKRPLVSAFDLLSCLLLIFVVLVLVSTTKKSTSQIETLGLYAVVITWPNGSKDDIDLYMQDPEGGLIFFASRDSGLMHLEHDDLGEPDRVNMERGILRGTLPG